MERLGKQRKPRLDRCFTECSISMIQGLLFFFTANHFFASGDFYCLLTTTSTKAYVVGWNWLLWLFYAQKVCLIGPLIRWYISWQQRSQRLNHVEAHQKQINGELSYLAFQIVNNKGTDQTVQMRRRVCAFVVRKQQSQSFLRQNPCDVEAQAS